MQIQDVGEVVLELGGPGGFGPQGMDASQLATAVAQITERAKAKGAQTTQVKPTTFVHENTGEVLYL